MNWIERLADAIEGAVTDTTVVRLYDNRDGSETVVRVFSRDVTINENGDDTQITMPGNCSYSIKERVSAEYQKDHDDD